MLAASLLGLKVRGGCDETYQTGYLQEGTRREELQREIASGGQRIRMQKAELCQAGRSWSQWIYEVFVTALPGPCEL